MTWKVAGVGFMDECEHADLAGRGWAGRAGTITSGRDGAGPDVATTSGGDGAKPDMTHQHDSRRQLSWW